MTPFSFSIRGKHSRELPGVVRSLHGCEKSIPDKILKRYDDPIFFSTVFFRRKKIIFQNEKNEKKSKKCY